MIGSDTQLQIDKIWEMFWVGGIANPLTMIEQLIYLLFLKSLDEKQDVYDKEAEHRGTIPRQIFLETQQDFRWKHLKEMSEQEMFDVISHKIFPFLKTIHPNTDSAFSKYMKDALFLIPTPHILAKIINSIDELNLESKDAKGDMYEYLLSTISQAGKNGQFRTPRHIIDLMVHLIKPVATDVICDPACGTGGFLVAASEYVKKEFPEIQNNVEILNHVNNHMFYGYDTDRTMLRIGAMNLMLHGIENPNIFYTNSLSEQNTDHEKYTVIFANPPFKGILDHESIVPSLLEMTHTRKTEILFLHVILRSLQIGGRCAVIVPSGITTNETSMHHKLRKSLMEDHQLEAVIEMPSGVFRPYTGISTAILIFTKTGNGGTEQVWFYQMRSDGYSLDDKRIPIPQNDIDDIKQRFSERKQEISRDRNDQSFLVHRDEIKEHQYILSYDTYKNIVYKKTVYEKPAKILEKIISIEKEIQSLIDEIKTKV